MYRVDRFLALTVVLCSCTSVRQDSTSTDSPDSGYQEAYGIYPAVACDGISRHLIRSHSSALMVRPASSGYELVSRLSDRVWDWGKRLEVRLIRFPALRRIEIPELVKNSEPMDLRLWEERLDTAFKRSSTTARVEFLIGGELFYSQLERAIDQAQYCIELQTYLFDNDDIAQGIADRLRARSGEIDVRVMFDGFGTYLAHTATADTQPAEYVPIKNIADYLCEGSGIRLRVLPNIWLSGNHIKSMIFDRRSAFVGGMNIGREYRHEWHDMMVKLEGKAVGILSERFATTWRLNGWGGDFTPQQVPQPGPSVFDVSDEVPIRLLYTLPTQAQIYRAQLEAIRRSRAYIYIENAYFADDRILYELCCARKRGVDVRIIMPAKVNHKIMEYSNRVAMNTLLDHGVRVYLYPEMSHIKAAVYDGWACLGTANFDKLSLQINRELNLATSHPETVQQLMDKLFLRDLKLSSELTEPVSLNLKHHLIELIADET